MDSLPPEVIHLIIQFLIPCPHLGLKKGYLQARLYSRKFNSALLPTLFEGIILCNEKPADFDFIKSRSSYIRYLNLPNWDKQICTWKDLELRHLRIVSREQLSKEDRSDLFQWLHEQHGLISLSLEMGNTSDPGSAPPLNYDPPCEKACCRQLQYLMLKGFSIQPSQIFPRYHATLLMAEFAACTFPSNSALDEFLGSQTKFRLMNSNTRTPLDAERHEGRSVVVVPNSWKGEARFRMTVFNSFPLIERTDLMTMEEVHPVDLSVPSNVS